MLAFDFSRLYSGFKIHTLMNKNVYESYTLLELILCWIFMEGMCRVMLTSGLAYKNIITSALLKTTIWMVKCST